MLAILFIYSEAETGLHIDHSHITAYQQEHQHLNSMFHQFSPQTY